MKKLLLLPIGLLLLSTNIACKKTYTCKCTANVNLGIFGGNQSTDLPDTQIEETKKVAKKICDSKSETVTYQGVGLQRTCTLH